MKIDVEELVAPKEMASSTPPPAIVQRDPAETVEPVDPIDPIDPVDVPKDVAA